MTVKEWLNRGYKLDNEIDALLEAQQKAFMQATSTTSSTDSERVQATKKNTSEHKFINYASYSDTINKRIDELYGIKQEIQNAIDKIDDSILRILLIHRYINFKTWEQIADSVYVDVRHIYRLHGKALLKMQDVIECHSWSMIKYKM